MPGRFAWRAADDDGAYLTTITGTGYIEWIDRRYACLCQRLFNG